ncbi:MAG: tetratricopeptide repeat protein [Sphingobacteriales bacterium]|jgi:tetratricopeptide (TPR) repeat protein|nr:tetratricopeptide repeat protein [Sphingobacteriales bacterium]MBP9140923.1 tetratricopeptide repeat protein [Chitinophagales bacterium]MDA0199866.1 tetratricopeptide repeat protein [Bacteroidota bacterium]MBK6889335.1 tetratricopeptide repeat protein [Sphingobacteriales bacterium]MBK7528164.1 tetratricopeptide repeat protein [Sphingobacteriales bacterium]
MSDKKISKQFHWLLPFLIVCITAICFYPSLTNANFVNWDDDRYLLNNIAKLTAPITAFFTQPFVDNYMPLTAISWVVNYKLNGLNPFGYHFVNLILHLLNTVLVYILVKKITANNLKMAVFVALFFAISPLRAESVAWATGRKDVLYMAFFLSGLLTWWQYIGSNHRKYYIYTLLFFVAALMSKPAAIVFPLILPLLEYLTPRCPILKGRALIEKLPFVGLAVLFGVITWQIQAGQAIGNWGQFSAVQKISFTCYALLQYGVNMLIPFKTAALHPYPVFDAQTNLPFYYYAAIPVAVLVFGLFLYWAYKNVWIRLALGIYIAGFLLVLPVWQVGNAIMADRYTYLSAIGLGLGLAWWLFSDKSQAQRAAANRWPKLVTALLGLWFFVSGWLTVEATQRWQNSELLWTHAIDLYPQGHFLAYNKRGEVFYEAGKFDRALADYEAAIKAQPKHYLGYAGRGQVLLNAKKFDQALPDFNQAISLNPQSAATYNSRGHLYYQTQQFEAALADYSKAIALDPTYYRAFNNRAIIYHTQGNKAAALADYDQALKLKPNYTNAKINRQKLLEQTP